MSVQYDNGYIMSLQSWWYVINSIMLSFRGDVIMIVGDTALRMENVRIYVTMCYVWNIIGYMWHCLFYERGNYVIMIISDIVLCMKNYMLLCDIAYCMKEEIICHYVYTRHCLCMKEEIICCVMIYNLISNLLLVRLCPT